LKVVQTLTNVFLSEQESDLLTSNHTENFPQHLKMFKENGLERAIVAKDLKDDGSHRIYTIAIFSDQTSYDKCIPLLKKYAELVEPSKSKLPQKMISSISKVLHDTDKT